MNCPTSRCSTPAAATRTGRGAFALPRDPGLDRLLADPNLGSTAKTIATALVNHWAWYKTSCWPSDKTIAGKVGKSPGHVQRCLRQLEDAGWIHRQRTDEVPTGRLIWLAWRCPTTSKGAQRSPAPAREGPPAPARDKRIVVVTGEVEREESAIPERQRPELIPPAPPATPAPQPKPTVAPAPAAVAPPSPPSPPIQPAAPVGAVAPPTPPLPAPRVEAPAPASPGLPLTPEQKARLDAMPAAARDQVLTWLMLGDPILVAEANKLLAPPRSRPETPRTLPEVLSRIREDPSFPALAADWLASALGDRKSYSGFKARCEEAWRGELSVARLVSAYEQAMGPRAKNRGALFMHAVRCDARDG
jgi:hypothetical protein